jgi:hypothetical protein
MHLPIWLPMVCAHSERVYQALKGEKRLILLPKTGHGVGLDEATWKIIDEWVTTDPRG